MNPDPTKVPPKTPGVSAIIGAVIGALAVWYLCLTPFVMIGWNVGLEPAGIVPTQIDWLTAFGLATVISILRGFIAAMKRPRVIYYVPVTKEDMPS